MINLSRSGNAWWSKRGITSVFRAPNIAFLLLLLLLMVTLPCLLLSPENKTLDFCAKMSTRKLPASVQGLVLDEEGELLESKILLALSTCQGIAANHCWIWGKEQLSSKIFLFYKRLSMKTANYEWNFFNEINMALLRNLTGPTYVVRICTAYCCLCLCVLEWEHWGKRHRTLEGMV